MTIETGVLIVTLEEGARIHGIELRVKQIDGVVDAEYNHITRKLTVRYGAAGSDRDRVRLELDKVLGRKKAKGKRPARPS